MADGEMTGKGVASCRACRNRQSHRNMVLVTLVFYTCLLGHLTVAQQTRIKCYDRNNIAQRCIPPFVNAAFNLPVETTNTCGIRGPEEYCLQTGVTGATQSCDICDARNPARSHPPRYLTDFNNNDNQTWWQSETMISNVQYPYSVNLTLHLGKSFDITYVRLKFHSSRPESFAIYKRTTESSDWIPYQFYSSSCQDTYNRRFRGIIDESDETVAICTDEFSDISPLTGGNVAFSTLEGRPGAFNFENSPVLQEWVTATDIKIVLNRLNTFGDEVFQDRRVLKSYFYAVSDFAVGGRCKCNGHASECIKSTGEGGDQRLVCRCEHNTMGADCGQCLPFYNDKPWGRATASDTHECQPCSCNDLSTRCFFDEDLYKRTGHGGHCMECQQDTAGPNCERCKDNYYREGPKDRCKACNCNPLGSEIAQCDQLGRCRCKSGVTGEKCDRCQPNYFDFGPSGCRPCACVVAGSLNNDPSCLPNTGICSCKEFVEGQNCDRCKPGHFALDADNPYGCQSCFCYGHSSVCTSAPGFVRNLIESEFENGVERWTAADRSGSTVTPQFNAFIENIGVSAPGSDAVYFLAPSRFLGDQRLSYNRFLTFSLRVGEDGARASSADLILEGAGRSFIIPIFAQGNPLPRTIKQNYKFRLHEHPSYQWSPQLNSVEFIGVLANLTSIKIRATYSANGAGFIDNVRLETAIPRRNGGEAANWVEQCSCPKGYVGQFCESCSPGYRRDPPNGGPFARCVPCDCNGHSDTCEVNTGRCICQYNTVGDNCERCAPGYYGYALAGTPNDCKPCPCPGNGECVQLLNNEVVCINCKEGYTGKRCDMCADGFYGDPTGRYGPVRPCQKCQCNDNIDPNAVGNCNTTTGVCLKCIHNTGGDFCSECLPGFYGDALDLPKGQCKACGCYPRGTVHVGSDSDPILCNQQNGQCPCQPNVVGRQCDKCRPGYWNIDSGSGCELCGCDRMGSYNDSCDIKTGQCACRPGVGTRQCSDCQENHYGFSISGCKACNCEPEGSIRLQCDLITGACPCKENVEGQQCDRCQENKYNISAGCIDCPPCYTLVQDRVNDHRRKLYNLRVLIDNIGENPGAINDTDFRNRLREVEKSVNDLLESAKNAIGKDSPVARELKALREAIDEVVKQCGKITSQTSSASNSASNSMSNIKMAEDTIDSAEEALKKAEEYIQKEGVDAILKARQAQEKFGQQSNRMTEIAKMAREEADKQTQEAERIENVAYEALNTSREALRIAKEALNKPDDTAEHISKLGAEVKDASSLYDQTKTLADKAKAQAEVAYKKSLDIFTEASLLELPKVDVDAFNKESNTVKTEAAEIKKEADDLINNNQQLIDDVAKQKEEAEELLKHGNKQQQTADELLAEAHRAREIAIDAVNLGDKTLREANETLNTLKAFDEKVKESKKQAEEALKKVPEIEDLIGQAEKKTQRAHDDLAGAESDAILARDLAQEAQSTAEMASTEAGDIRTEAEKMKERATQLKDRSTALAEDVQKTTGRLADHKKQGEEDEKLAKEALEKADQAKTSAIESSGKVKGALDAVMKILSTLAGLDSIDTNALDQLNRNLTSAEKQLEDANLAGQYDILLKASKQQKEWVDKYTFDLIQLQKDVENVRQINATIPRECLRGNIEIESTF